MSTPKVSMLVEGAEDAPETATLNPDGSETTYTLLKQLSTRVLHSTAIVRPPSKVWIKDLATRPVIQRDDPDGSRHFVVEGTYMVVGQTHVLV
jgi:hypothetical protein